MLSVVLAAYNGGIYIHDQIASILPQLSTGDELIVSDDGSSDNTMQVVAAFNDTRIKLDLNPSESLGKMLFSIVQNVVFAIIGAALYIASALLCTTDIEPQIAGMPVLAILGFILATVIVVIMILKWVYYFKHSFKG